MLKHKGQFKIGNPGGPGRPKRQTEADYLLAMMEEVPLDTWRNVVKAAVAGAQKGDYRAREWLSKYLVGEPTTVAAAPIQLVVQQLLQQDPALARAAKELSLPVKREAGFLVPPEIEEVIEREAAEAILAASSS